MSETPSLKSKVLIFGAGNFGSCLADHLGDSQHDVFMWSREQTIVDHFNLYHRNLRYLTDHNFSPNIKAIGPELPDQDFLARMDVLLFAIPTQALRFVASPLESEVVDWYPLFRATLTKLRPKIDDNKLPLLIFVNKGIEIGTNALTLDIIADICGAKMARAASFIVRFPVNNSLRFLLLKHSLSVWTFFRQRE
jgi:glycerol-3-phosphate dehydrogenase